MTRVLAAVVAPPHLSVSGAAKAAEALSEALVPHCDMTFASMVQTPGAQDTSQAGALARLPVHAWLPGPVPWHRLPKRYRTLFYRSDIPDRIRRGSFDLVHIHNPMPALEMRRIARACTSAGVPYVVSTHGFNEIANGRRIYNFGHTGRAVWRTLVEAPVAEVVQGAAAIFTLSPADDGIVRRMGARSVPTVVVTNGVALPPRLEPATSGKLLGRFGITPERDPGQITCMFLANHTPNKGLPVLLQAFRSIERPFLLIVVGERRPENDYDAAVRACRPGQRIIVTGRVSDEDVAALYARSDLFVFPTLADTFPLVVLEAMSQGVPVIASRVGGVPHQLGPEAGRLVTPGDPRELALAVEELAADPDRRMEMGRAARLRAAAMFTWPQAARAAIAGYDLALRRASATEAPAPGNPVRWSRAAHDA